MGSYTYLDSPVQILALIKDLGNGSKRHLQALNCLRRQRRRTPEGDLREKYRHAEQQQDNPEAAAAAAIRRARSRRIRVVIEEEKPRALDSPVAGTDLMVSSAVSMLRRNEGICLDKLGRFDEALSSHPPLQHHNLKVPQMPLFRSALPVMHELWASSTSSSSSSSSTVSGTTSSSSGSNQSIGLETINEEPLPWPLYHDGSMPTREALEDGDNDEDNGLAGAIADDRQRRLWALARAYLDHAHLWDYGESGVTGAADCANVDVDGEREKIALEADALDIVVEANLRFLCRLQWYEKTQPRLRDDFKRVHDCAVREDKERALGERDRGDGWGGMMDAIMALRD